MPLMVNELMKELAICEGAMHIVSHPSQSNKLITSLSCWISGTVRRQVTLWTWTWTRTDMDVDVDGRGHGWTLMDTDYVKSCDLGKYK
jgi:hypothetical protein